MTLFCNHSLGTLACEVLRMFTRQDQLFQIVGTDIGKLLYTMLFWFMPYLDELFCFCKFVVFVFSFNLRLSTLLLQGL